MIPMFNVRTAFPRRLLSVSLAISLSAICSLRAAEQPGTQRYLWMVTIDGLRPEEVFTGADNRLIDKEIGGVSDPQDLLVRFWDEDSLVRRKKLLPFFWQVVAEEGQVFGSAAHGSLVKVENGRFFSYPGYQEILCGFPDDKVDSNDKKHNANVSVLEWLSKKPQYEGQIAAFASWDVFPFILNAKRSGLYVNAGWQPIEVTEGDETKRVLNQAIRETPHYWQGARFDYYTFAAAMEYLKVKQPTVLYLALDETDDWCHDGRYDLYLDAAHRCDQHLRALWEYAQSNEKYRGKTSMIITTDHGRGGGREGWKNHGTDLPGSEFIWMAVLGPDTPALGVRHDVSATQAQYAASAALLLGEDFTECDPKVRSPLPGIHLSQKVLSTASAK